MPFEPGSDFESAVVSARMRVEHGQTDDFGQALESVLADRIAMRTNPHHRPAGALDDWNWSNRKGTTYNPFGSREGIERMQTLARH